MYHHHNIITTLSIVCWGQWFCGAKTISLMSFLHLHLNKYIKHLSRQTKIQITFFFLESIWLIVSKGRDKAIIELTNGCGGKKVSADNILNKVKKFLNIINQMLTNMTLRRLQTTRPPLFWIFSNQSRLDFSTRKKSFIEHQFVVSSKMIIQY